MDSLIKSVVPSVGFYCLTTIQNKAVRSEFFDDRDELVKAGLAASRAGKNAYYAMASFKDASARVQDNVQYIKSFWLDVDCKNKDPEKDYANKDDGIQAIQSFCKKHAFPRPIIVDSGNGWHVYWALTEAIHKDQWQPIADKLKSLCLLDGLRIDPACTADSARILRIPNTLNYRFDTPSEVKIMLESPEVELDLLSLTIDVAYDSIDVPQKPLSLGTPVKRELSATTKALLGNNTSSFKKILTRTANGTGCAQIAHCVENQGTIEEPLWRGILSVANVCTDRDKAIHFASNQHPEYDPDFTEDKASKTKGPYTCATFDGLRANVCSSCPNYKKITSPIQLGSEIAASQEPVVVNIAEIKKPVATNQPVEVAQITNEMATVTQIKPPPVDLSALDARLARFHHEQLNVTIPIPPRPYLRGVDGGIYKQTRAEDGTFEDVLIYEDDFYPHARLYDPVDGQVLACRLHMPMDGIRNFNIPLKSVGSKDELRRIICSQGVAASENTVKELSFYLIAMTKELRQMHAEEKARTQMGWQEDNSFVLGNREYSKTGIRHCPPSSATMNTQNTFRMEGTLSEWRDIIDVYKQPGFEIHQFLYFFMTSSPLLRFIDQPGMMASMISDESGVGKSTLGQICNSLWGHPDEMTSMPHDTVNAVVHRMGVFNNLGFYIDEFTNKTAEVCSDIIYMAGHGRGKERMSSSANVERVNNTHWSQNTMVSANASLTDKVASLKASSEAENMRIFEFDMRGSPVLDKAYADAKFSKLKDNYGVGGHIYAAWLVENVHQIEGLVTDTRKRLDERFKFTSKERKWSAAIAAAYTNAAIQRELGLHDFDINANIDYMIMKIKEMRYNVKESITKHDAFLADFLSENHSNILIIDAMPDANGLYATPKNRNINKIIARWEPDTKKLFISSSVIKDYCTKKQFSYQSLVQLTGAKSATKRMASGTGVATAPVRVLEFDTNTMNLDMSIWHDAGEMSAAA